MSWSEYAKTRSPETELHLSARTGNLDGLDRALGALISAGGGIDEPDPRGNSPLLTACYYGNLDAARALLSRGADPNRADRGGNTILMVAAFRGQLEIVKLLIHSGADRSVQNPQGLTALDFAARARHDAVVQYLSTHQ